MKIVFDVDVIKDFGIICMVYQVVEWGYKYIEQLLYLQINLFYKYLCVSWEIMVEYKQVLCDIGFELLLFICVYCWFGLDELCCQVVVKNWKWLVEIVVEMGVQVINIEFFGDLNQFEICDEMFYCLMEELLLIFEWEGICVEIQVYFWDFCEENNEIVDIVKLFCSDNVKYVYSVLYIFFYDKGVGDVVSMLCYVGSDFFYVLIVDICNYMKYCCYIVNLLGVDVVVYQYVGVGEGDVDFDVLFCILCEMKFVEQIFKVGGELIVVILLFGYLEKMKYQVVEICEFIECELLCC